MVYGVDEVVASALLEAAPDGMMMVDEQGQIRWSTLSIEALFGYGRDELVGRPVEVLLPSTACGEPIGPIEPGSGLSRAPVPWGPG